MRNNIPYGIIVTRWLRQINFFRLGCWIFAAALLFRFFYVFNANPFYHLFSDPRRHWDNAGVFFHPNLMGGTDPIMYQAYLAAVRFITNDHPLGLAFFAGLLSVLMPCFWYKALRELLPSGWALTGAILIALMPSLIMIYSYFMTETLLLTLVAAAIWLSFRALRLGTFGAYAWAALFWTLASYTRIANLPMAGIFLGILCLQQWRQMPLRILLASGMFGLMLLPACWHSQMALHFCAPFGYSKYSEIMNAAQSESVTFHLPPNYSYTFGMCITHSRPLAPFSDWTYGAKGNFEFTIDLNAGKRDWDIALERARARPGKPYTPLQKFIAKVLSLFFDPSWPDNNADYRMGWLAIQSRWLALPMTLLVAGLTARYYRRMAWEKLLLPGITLLMLGIMIAQPMYAIEGRYRKPLEPMLIASCLILLHERRQLRKSAQIPGIPAA